jgi:uncharacterized membrane protein
MFDLINGIPLHPLVVHAVVVLLPLAVIGAILIAVRPPWRTTYGPLVLAVAGVATILVPVATSSGESLAVRVGDPGNHAHLGDQLIWFTIPLLILVLALVLLDRRDTRRATTRTSRDTDTKRFVHSSDTRGGSTTTTNNSTRAGTATTMVAVLAVLAALAAGVQVYRVGDSGARAVWGDRVGSDARLLHRTGEVDRSSMRSAQLHSVHRTAVTA